MFDFGFAIVIQLFFVLCQSQRIKANIACVIAIDQGGGAS